GYSAKVLAHGITGGVMSKLQGGKFGHGFASAGVTQAFASGVDRLDADNLGVSAGRIAAAAIVGGTASHLSGGKFANGAITAAFSRAFNDELHRDQKHPRDWTDDEWRQWHNEEALRVFAPFTGPF